MCIFKLTGLLLFPQLRLFAGIAKKKNFFQQPRSTGDMPRSHSVHGLSWCSFRRGFRWVATFYLFRWRLITKMIFQMQVQNYAGIGPHTEVCSSAKGARIAWLHSGVSLSQVREHGLRVTHLCVCVGGEGVHSQILSWILDFTVSWSSAKVGWAV